MSTAQSFSELSSLEQENPFRNIHYTESILEANFPSVSLGGPLFKAFCDGLRNEGFRWAQVKQKMVHIANYEHVNIWKSGSRRETHPDMLPVIRRYWSQGVYEGQAVPKYINIPGSPWSSAFIAWVINHAGGGDRFSKVGRELKYRPRFVPAAHWRYVAAAKINRERNEFNPFRAFRVNEVKPELGDIVVKSRNRSGATFQAFEGRNTHGDIVVEVKGNEIVVIGGNVSNTVARRKVPLNATGFIQSTGGANNDHFAIVRIVTDIFKSPLCNITRI